MGQAAKLESRKGQRRTPELDARDRAVVLQASLGVLEKEGGSALSMRRVAAEIGASYQVVYTLFGGRTGLLDALFRHGFERLAETCRAVPRRGSATQRMIDFALRCRAFAHEHRRLYALMFGRGVQGFEPDAESRLTALASFDVVREACAEVLAERAEARRRFQDDLSLARAAWAATHGHVVLELGSWFGHDPHSAERLAQLMAALVGGEVEPT